ncbi:hypothetical protein DWV78_10280 [Agathobacter rectalis]|uniref:Uncharacterized protein n=1 Tax=Agathobacter rectalis TaxID=39491 RepID=A0A413BF03_9FIRM|nr:hypothetical protein DWV78_10280 [Agathobacter rectalis]
MVHYFENILTTTNVDYIIKNANRPQMRTNIKRIDMLKILLLAKFKDSKFCYIIILRVAKQLIQLNNNYRYSDNSGSDT